MQYAVLLSIDNFKVIISKIKMKTRPKSRRRVRKKSVKQKYISV